MWALSVGLRCVADHHERFNAPLARYAAPIGAHTKLRAQLEEPLENPNWSIDLPTCRLLTGRSLNTVDGRVSRSFVKLFSDTNTHSYEEQP